MLSVIIEEIWSTICLQQCRHEYRCASVARDDSSQICFDQCIKADSIKSDGDSEQEVEKLKLRGQWAGQSGKLMWAATWSLFSVGRFPRCRHLLAPFFFFNARPPALWPLVNALCWVLPFTAHWCQHIPASTWKRLLRHISFSQGWSRWGHWVQQSVISATFVTLNCWTLQLPAVTPSSTQMMPARLGKNRKLFWESLSS